MRGSAYLPLSQHDYLEDENENKINASLVERKSDNDIDDDDDEESTLESLSLPLPHQQQRRQHHTKGRRRRRRHLVFKIGLATGALLFLFLAARTICVDYLIVFEQPSSSSTSSSSSIDSNIPPIEPPSPPPPPPPSEPAPAGWKYYYTPSSQQSPLLSSSSSTRQIQLTRSQILLSPSCQDLWISKSLICPTLNSTLHSDPLGPGKVDVLWTWINGSDPYLTPLREEASRTYVSLRKPSAGKSGSNKGPSWKHGGIIKPPSSNQKTKTGVAEHHFRDHNELKYSMRSAMTNLPPSIVNKFHLFTSSLPLHRNSNSNLTSQEGEEEKENGSWRMGHIPTWLDLSPDRRGRGNSNSSIPVQVTHHWESFKVTEQVLREMDYEDGERGAEKWREDVLPSFNSLSIETQLPHHPSLSPSSTLIYLNDDYYLLRPLSLSDFTSPLFGPVFRIQHSWSFSSLSPTQWLKYPNDLEGEKPTIMVANYYLSRRFGERNRGYVRHVARTMDVSIMREMSEVFGDVLAVGGGVRLRGRAPQVHLAFMVTWYHIERHREALLYSFLILRSDPTLSGVLTPALQTSLLTSIGPLTEITPTTSKPHIPINVPLRSSLNPLSSLSSAGLSTPKATRYEFVSANGYAMAREDGGSWPDYSKTHNGNERRKACKLFIKTCFPPGFASHLLNATATNGTEIKTEDIFRRMAFQVPSCGDCLIQGLLGQSGEQGLEAFLPSSRPDLDTPLDFTSPSSTPFPLIGAFTPTHLQSSFSPPPPPAQSNPRQYALSLLTRYSYTLGDTPFTWLMMKSNTTASPVLKPLMEKEKVEENGEGGGWKSNVALLAINDDVPDGKELGPTERLMREFHETRWGSVRGWWEKDVNDEMMVEEGEGERVSMNQTMTMTKSVDGAETS